MVGDKYTRLAPLARLSPLCPYSVPAVLREVGEVIYSLAKNMTDISTSRIFVHTPQHSASHISKYMPPPAPNTAPPISWNSTSLISKFYVLLPEHLPYLEMYVPPTPPTQCLPYLEMYAPHPPTQQHPYLGNFRGVFWNISSLQNAFGTVYGVYGIVQCTCSTYVVHKPGGVPYVTTTCT